MYSTSQPPNPKFTFDEKTKWLNLVNYFENQLEAWVKGGWLNEVWKPTDDRLDLLKKCFDHPVMAEDIKKYDYASFIDEIKERMKEKGGINKTGLKGYYNEAYPDPRERFSALQKNIESGFKQYEKSPADPAALKTLG